MALVTLEEMSEKFGPTSPEASRGTAIIRFWAKVACSRGRVSRGLVFSTVSKSDWGGFKVRLLSWARDWAVLRSCSARALVDELRWATEKSMAARC